ncbi:hypothetical protein V8G54_018520 [Vigna mungo]|uniref:Uncharacterized protein n=1 Tax=Vigna mungo TaxID=3915 RepID=A0AAQ3N8J1_VIGMU
MVSNLPNLHHLHALSCSSLPIPPPTEHLHHKPRVRGVHLSPTYIDSNACMGMIHSSLHCPAWSPSPTSPSPGSWTASRTMRDPCNACNTGMELPCNAPGLWTAFRFVTLQVASLSTPSFPAMLKGTRTITESNTALGHTNMEPDTLHAPNTMLL